jgi:isoquinoline 1-oxidoreductase subunit beta
MNRRHFLQASALTAGGLLLGGAFGSAEAAPTTEPTGPTALNAWVRISRDGAITLILSQAEMGQGVTTTLPAIIAEELCADWSHVRVENAPVDPAYRNPRARSQFTGNAESVRSFYTLLRTMGAAAREMLIAAAASTWRVPPASCKAEASTVIHVPTGRRLRYGELAERAARLPVPQQPALKPPEQWSLVGRSLPRGDIPAKVMGTAVFGIDVEIEGMLHAAIQHCPVFGGKVATVDESSIAGMPGIVQVVRLQDAVAVVARSYWEARRALERLQVTFEQGPHSQVSSEALDALYQAALDGERWSPVLAVGEARAAIASARAQGERVVTAEYSSAWQAHATMEPMNCTAHVTANMCELWTPTQGQEMVQKQVAGALGLPPESVKVNRTYLGGGFGRRLVGDYAVQAALVSRAVGRPVKLLWSREEDMRHDLYRPRVVHRITAALGADGLPVALEQQLVSPTILSAVIPPAARFRYPAVDPSCVEGLREMLYSVPHNRLDFHLLEVPVPTMVWRTTGYGPNLFSLECFIDELAAAAGQDPYTYRKALLQRSAESTRALAVLERVVAEAGWPGKRAEGRYMGLALAHAFNTYIAQVVELSLPAPDTVDIHRVVSVVDCGRVLDPGVATAGVQGGITWGLTQCLSSEITFARGQVEQGNFNTFRLLSLPEAPRTEVHFIDSGAPPGGMGEVGPITVAPALCNALFAATGKRYRTLPLARHGIYTRYARQFV